MIDPLAGMLWTTAITAVLIAAYFLEKVRTPVSSAVQAGADASKNTAADSALIPLAVLGAFITAQGFWMMDTWPLVGSYNILFGEIYAMFGVTVLAGSVAALRGYSLRAVSYIGGLMGLWGLVDAYGILADKLTSEPTLAAAMYAAGGIAGILSIPAVNKPSRATVLLLAVFLALFALSALVIGAEASFEHLKAFA